MTSWKQQIELIRCNSCPIHQLIIFFLCRSFNCGKQFKMEYTSFLTINFLLRTFRDWLVKFEAIALQNPALLTNTMRIINQNKQERYTCKQEDDNEGTICKRDQCFSPIKWSLSHGSQCYSTNNWEKRRDDPYCRELLEQSSMLVKLNGIYKRTIPWTQSTRKPRKFI